MAHQEKSPLPPHVLIFPFPVQGHVNSMLKLAELLSLAAVHVTFLLSDFSHHRLLRHTDTHLRFSRYPGFRFETISDGLPDDHPRAGERVTDFVPSLKNVTGPLFEEMMVASDCLRSEDRRPVTCIIADGILSFAGDFALEKGIPLVYFRTISACAFWAYFRFQEVIEAGEVPLKASTIVARWSWRATVALVPNDFPSLSSPLPSQPPDLVLLASSPAFGSGEGKKG
ncbi:hypothetical protein RHMOL_Rhmol09G0231100 [Rhododendron molle]|uniref:Uncharacterized protein n=1 Tax=Rhododendron molle TaxID=49168 RepID=A0ACC0MHU0_RHOML|nr:hypothetical protein RHMOL_Rhmol09G0231100 [Rhododendron molle]